MYCSGLLERSKHTSQVDPNLAFHFASGTVLAIQDIEPNDCSLTIPVKRPSRSSDEDDREAFRDPRVRTPGGWTAWDKSFSDPWVKKDSAKSCVEKMILKNAMGRNLLA